MDTTVIYKNKTQDVMIWYLLLMFSYWENAIKKFHMMNTDNPPKFPITTTQGADSAIHYFGSSSQNAEAAKQHQKFK